MNLTYVAHRSKLKINFWVTGSLVPNMFNAGGDLCFFVESFKNGRREALRSYARVSFDCTHENARGFDTGAVTIAMFEGSAAAMEINLMDSNLRLLF